MVASETYNLPPTALIPNSKYPLIRYPSFLPPDVTASPATRFYDILSSNGWQAQWIYRYGQTQKSHYHSLAHECMVVLTGAATIRFGVADTTDDMEQNTWGNGWEAGGLELEARAGDVFIIPAGVAHKTYNTRPAAPFQRLSPGDGHGLPDDIRDKLDDIELDGFTMMGSYPKDGVWDFMEGGEGAAAYAQVWAIPPPDRDPMLGRAQEGICGLWRQSDSLKTLKGRL